MPLSLAQARKSNPHAVIVLMGDKNNSRNYEFYKKYNIKHVLIDHYYSAALAFNEIYKHEGPNHFLYERFCFERWLIINEYVQHNSISGNICCLDSDALLYQELDTIFNLMSADLAVCDVVGPQYLIIKKAIILKKYCEFIFKCFDHSDDSNDLKIYIACNKDKLPNHVNDMATLGAFSMTIPHLDFGTKSEIGIYFDENVSYSQGLDTSIFGKKVYRINGRHYFKRSCGKLIRAGGIHAQGQSKQFMILYVDRSIAFSLINLRISYELLMGFIRIGSAPFKFYIKKMIRCIS